MNPSARFGALFCSWALIGCSVADGPAEAEPTYQPLVTLTDWATIDRDADPFVTDLDAAPACIASGVRTEPEQSWLELDTAQCGWITLRADAQHAVELGQPLQLSISHYDLEAATLASAELRLTFAGCSAWSKSVSIPSPAAVYVEEFDSPCALRERGEVLFHLHNHGQNTYQLRALSVLR